MCSVAACPHLAMAAFGTEDGGVWVMEHSSAAITNRGPRPPSLQIAGALRLAAGAAGVAPADPRE